MKILVVPEPFNDMQSNIALIIGPNDLMTSIFKDPADSIAKDGTSQVSDMKGFMGIGLGELHHQVFTFGLSSSKLF